MSRKIVLAVLLLVLAFSGSAFAEKKLAPEGSPTRAIQDLDNELGEYRLGAKSEEDIKFNEALKRKVLGGTFDIKELCRLALAHHWNERSEKEKVEFVDLMTGLLEKKAIFAGEQGVEGTKKGKGRYYVSYDGDRYLNADKSKAIVRTTVHIKREDLHIGIEYKMRNIDGLWKIYDVIVDGASLLNNYKYQFDQIVKKDGYDNLLRRMKSKLTELSKR